ncbi:MAG: PilC/PilY family type IV pilus protein [Pseudoxanthomonas sp.]
MATRRTSIIAIFAALAALAGGGLYLAKAVTWTTAPPLAQAPLNVVVETPPAFIMAIDDSGSMFWEVLNNTRDGVFAWADNTSGSGSFYNGTTAYGYNSNTAYNYYYTFPDFGYRDGNNAIPPLDAFGFARSPDVNPAYFDPREEYPTWKNADGSDYMTITPAAARRDPRATGSTSLDTGTLDLTATQESTTDSNQWRFRVRAGMWIPKGARVMTKSGSSCTAVNASGKSANISTSGAYVALSQDTRITAACYLHMSYFPATFFLVDSSTLPDDYGYKTAAVTTVTTGTAPLVGGRPGTLYKYEIKPDNFDTTAQYEAAIQNFANWFSFYRTRREALIGGALNALVDADKMRVGWFRINDRQAVTMREMSTSDTTEKQALFDELTSMMRATSGTPTRASVRFLGQQFQRTDSSAPIQKACQKNAGMLFTDGYINDSTSITVGNVDTSMGSPFADSYSNTMADIAAYYYNTNLRSDLDAGLVPVPEECGTLSESSTAWKKLDCQTNPHMNFYGVALGAQGNQFGVTYIQDDDDPTVFTPDPYDNPPTWEARADLAPEAVDEMWHATMNARGEMINAKSPAGITAAMRRIIASVASGSPLAGTLGMTGSRVGEGSLQVVPEYSIKNNGTDWSGELKGYELSTETTYVTQTVAGITYKQAVNTVVSTQAWSASAKLPAYGSRNIQFGKLNADGTSATDFTSANVAMADLCASTDALKTTACTTAQLNTLTSSSIATAVNYLRGDTTNEGTLRTRTTLLGDIVNSSPVIANPYDDYGYSWMDSDYADYLEEKEALDRPQIFVGANDGMFHVFDGRTDSNGGVERFAYIPATSVGHMGNLLFPYKSSDADDQKFEHRYFVDGQVAMGDVQINGTWKTIVVGASGAGGKSVFALDVTDPDDIEVLWEVNNLVGTHAGSMGYVLGKPVIVPVKTSSTSTSWKVIFGNGYNSTNQSATLFVVDAGTGAVSTITAADSVSTDVPGYNGLGNVVVTDNYEYNSSGTAIDGGDGYYDTVYGADQTGAVWKFDLRGSGSVDRGGRPLFIARAGTTATATRQAILGGLEVAAGPGNGRFLYFGTGSYSFEDDDTATAVTETLYGILDTDTIANPVTTTVTRSNLTTQSTGTESTDSGVTYLTTSLCGQVASTSCTVGAYGWYLDLPSGQRMVGNPSIAEGVVFFPVYEPGDDSDDDCTTSSENWLYGLNALTGAAGLSDVRVGSATGSSPASGTGAIKLDTSGSSPVKDVAVMTTARSTACAADDTDCLASVPAGCYTVVQVAGASAMYLPRACGRQSWRQVR